MPEEKPIVAVLIVCSVRKRDHMTETALRISDRVEAAKERPYAPCLQRRIKDDLDDEHVRKGLHNDAIELIRRGFIDKVIITDLYDPEVQRVAMIARQWKNRLKSLELLGAEDADATNLRHEPSADRIIEFAGRAKESIKAA